MTCSVKLSAAVGIKKRGLQRIPKPPLSAHAGCAISLEKKDHCIEAKIGEEALDILSVREDIDLVLLDYLLPPGIDGLQVLKKMRELGCHVPVIIITGHRTQMICRDAFKSGVKDYVTKPFKVGEFRKTISGVLAVPEVKKPPVDRAIEFMEEQYCRPISASDVAQGVGLSYPHLISLFRAEKGCAITDWLNTVRINKAKFLLRKSNLEVKEVAAKMGFRRQQYFCRVFKMYVGCTPTEYRAKCR